MTEPSNTSTTRAARTGPILAGMMVVLVAAAGIAFAATRPAKTVAAVAAAPQGGCANVTASGLGWAVRDGKAGAGAMPSDTDIVLIRYRGTLTNGTEFDKSDQAVFPVAQVVPGFSEGLKLMKRGGAYKLCIPPALGYGASAAGPIPANSTLLFDVDLVDFKSMAEIEAMQRGEAAK